MRPITSLFHPAISLSIAGQLAIHLYCMVTAISMAKQFSSAEEMAEAMGLGADGYALPPPPPVEVDPAADAAAGPLLTPFKPSLLNTVVFLIETAQQVGVGEAWDATRPRDRNDLPSATREHAGAPTTRKEAPESLSLTHLERGGVRPEGVACALKKSPSHPLSLSPTLWLSHRCP